MQMVAKRCCALFVALILLCGVAAPGAMAEGENPTDGGVNAGSVTLNIGKGDITITDNGASGCLSDGTAIIDALYESYIITGTTSVYNVTVSVTGKASLTLSAASIQGHGSPLSITSGSVELTLSGVSYCRTTENDCAGVRVADGTCLTIDGAGTLNARGRCYAAGIGGSIGGTGGTIIINGGVINAIGGYDQYTSDNDDDLESGGAGIGSARGRSCKLITINGGTVTATANTDDDSERGGMGIGCGYSGSGGSVIVNGGSVLSTSDVAKGAEVIGTVQNSAGETLRLNKLLPSGASATLPATLTVDGVEQTLYELQGGYLYLYLSDSSIHTVSYNGKTIKLTPIVTLNWKNKTVKYGDTDIYLTATHTNFDPEAKINYSIVIITNLADVDSSTGHVTPKGIGTATLAATVPATTHYNMAAVNASLTILKGDPVISTSKDLYEVSDGSGVFSLGASHNGIDGDTLSFESSEPSVATVDESGNVTPVGVGVCTVTLSLPDTSHYNAASKAVTVRVLTKAGQTYGYDVSKGNVVLSVPGTYRITGSTTENRIRVTGTGVYNITLDGVNITLDDIGGSIYGSAMSIENGADVNLTLSGENKLKGCYSGTEGCHCAGILKLKHEGVLTIDGDGSLLAQGDNDSAGIGGTYYGISAETGNIVINGGTITAVGGSSAAGIGGGYGNYAGSCSDITINGGIVTATGGTYAAGIGSGSLGTSANIKITGGTVTAVAGTYSDAIGKANGNLSSSVVITGGSVKAASVTSPTDGKGNALVCKTVSIANCLPSYIISVDGADREIMVPHVGDTNLYIWTKTEQAVAVVKAQPVITAEPDSYSKTYGNEPFDIDFTHNGKQTATFSSGNEAVAKVDATGRVTIVGAGKAVITISLPECGNEAAATKTVTVNVAAALPQYTAPTGLITVFGEDLSSITLPEGFSWESSGKVGNVGTNSFFVKFTPNDTVNYAVVEHIEVSVSVSKAAAPAIQWPTASGLTYGQKLSGSALSDADTNGSFQWKNAGIIPDVKNDGFTVIYTPSDADNYDYTGILLEKVVPVDVSAMEVTVTPLALQGKVYGQNDPVLNYTNTSLSGNDSITGCLSRVSGDDVGNYDYCLGDLTAGDNYTLVLADGATFKVSPKPVTLSWSGYEGLYYDGAAKSVAASVENLEHGDSCIVTVSGADSIAAGRYTATATALSNKNYTLEDGKNLSREYVILAMPMAAQVDISDNSVGFEVTFTNEYVAPETAKLVAAQYDEYGQLISVQIRSASDGSFAFEHENGMKYTAFFVTDELAALLPRLQIKLN